MSTDEISIPKWATVPTHIFLCPWAGALAADLTRFIDGYEAIFPGLKVTILPRDHETPASTVKDGSRSLELKAALDGLKSATERQALLIHMVGLEGMFTAAQLLFWHKKMTGRPLQVKCTVEQPIPAGVISTDSWTGAAANGTWKLLVGPHDDLVQQRVLATLYDKALTAEGIKRCRFGRGAALDEVQTTAGGDRDSRGGMVEKANWKIIEAAWYGDVKQ